MIMKTTRTEGIENTQSCRRGYKSVLAVLSLGIVLSAFVGCRQSTRGTLQNGSANQAPTTQQVETPGQVVDRGDLQLRYQPRKKRTAYTDSHVVGSNPQAIEKLISDLNRRLILPFDIYVVFVDCESPDAFYDPETHEVTLCYQLIDDYYDLFARRVKDKTKLADAKDELTGMMRRLRFATCARPTSRRRSR